MAKKKEKLVVVVEPKDVSMPEGFDMSYSKDSIILTDDGTYRIALLPDMNTEEELNPTTAYVEGDIFYLYRGIPEGYTTINREPGIYDSKEGDETKYFLVPPRDSEEEDMYRVSTHVCTISPISIIDTCNTTEDLLIAIPESARAFKPEIKDTDDFLKLVLKKIILEKDIDVDRSKDRFSNKNEVFNFKQGLKGDSKISIKIFDRAMEAFNLKYKLIVEDRDDNDFVGNLLKEPLVISSEDGYVL